MSFVVKCMKEFKGKGPYNIDMGYNKQLWSSGCIRLAGLGEKLYDSNLALVAVKKWIPAAKAKLME